MLRTILVLSLLLAGPTALAQVPPAGEAVAGSQSACDQGDAQACFELAGWLLTGQGTAKSEAAAAQRFAQACDGGHAAACGYLGYCYELGQGVTQDRARGQNFLRKACEAGASWACSDLRYQARSDP